MATKIEEKVEPKVRLHQILKAVIDYIQHPYEVPFSPDDLAQWAQEGIDLLAGEALGADPEPVEPPLESRQEASRIGASHRLRVVAQVRDLYVYKRPRAPGMKPFVVGKEQSGKLILLEEFNQLTAAKDWAQEATSCGV